MWAELFLVARAPDPVAMAETWHGEDTERYDFACGQQRLEVKASAGRVRQHHFSLEQLKPPAKTRLLIASLFVEASGGGATVADLVDRIRQPLYDVPSLLLRIDSRVAAVIGDSWRDLEQQAFDFDLAC